MPAPPNNLMSSCQNSIAYDPEIRLFVNSKDNVSRVALHAYKYKNVRRQDDIIFYKTSHPHFVVMEDFELMIRPSDLFDSFRSEKVSLV